MIIPLFCFRIVLILNNNRFKWGIGDFLRGKKKREQKLKSLMDKKNIVFLQNWKK